MKLNTLKPAKGSLGREKRIGRGEGSGHGGTSTRGMNGAKQRSGYANKLGFQGGQMPIQRQLPKFGFTNTKKVVYKVINLSSLQSLSEKLQQIKAQEKFGEDDAYIESVARSQLDMVYPGEVIFRVSGDEQ